MHEANFTNQIVQTIMTELKKHPHHKPKRAKVKVGEIYHLNPDSVKMHYAALAKGTALEGTELELVETKVVVYCWQCSYRGPVADHHFLMCGVCNSTDVEVMSGNEIVIDTIEIERP